MDNKTLIALIAFTFLVSPVVAVDGIVVDSGVVIDQPGQNTVFNSSSTFSVSELYLYQSTTNFDNSNFTVKSSLSDSVTVYLNQFNRTAVRGENTAYFDADTSADNTVNFTYTNLITQESYTAFRNNNLLKSGSTDSTGFFYFSNDVWSRQTFNLTRSDVTPPSWRNLKDNATTNTDRLNSVNISAEWKDDGTGLYKTVLATNETGAWQNKTNVYGSPQTFNNVTGEWVASSFTWKNTSMPESTIAYKIYGRDQEGNWNVTDTGQFKLSSLQLSESIATTPQIEDNTSTESNYTDIQETTPQTDTANRSSFQPIQSIAQGINLSSITSFFSGFTGNPQSSTVVQQNTSTTADLVNSLTQSIESSNTPFSSLSSGIIQITQATNTTTSETVLYDYSVLPTQITSSDTNTLTTMDYLTESITQASTTTGIDVVTSYISQPLEQSEVDSENTTIVDYTTQALTSTPVTSIVEPTVQYLSSLFSSIESDTSVENNINPTIDSAKLIVTGLQDGAEVKANISVSDENGNLQQIQINGITRQVSGFKDYIVFDIADRLEETYTARVYDTNGKIQQKQVGFNIRERTPVHVGTNENISSQTARLNDSIENTGKIPLNYSLTHNTFNATAIQGPTHTGTVQVNETDYFSTEIRGDFLEEEKQWHTDNSVYNTVENQTIVQTLNITSEIPSIEWTDINTTSTSAPAPFQPCDNCGSQTVSFTDSYSNLQQWSDTGDGINNQYVQNLADVIIGERDEWWEQYRYNNLTSEVRFENIWANSTIDDTQTEYTQPFVRIEEGNTFNNTFNLEETQACNTKDTGIDSFNLEGQEWRGCATDTDGNDKSDYFRIRIPSFSDFNVRYGLGERPEQQFQYTLGDPCPDSLEGDTFDNNTLVCYRNEIMNQEDASLDTRDISRELGIGISGLVIAILIVIILYLIFVDERNFDLGRILNNSNKSSDEGFGYDP